MRVVVNALSVTNLSGRYVLLGHLQKIALWTRGQHHFDVLFHSSNRDICKELGPNVHWVECPAFTAHWPGRSAWEASALQHLAARLGSDFLFTPSGALVPGLEMPQVVFAQNPWALVKGLKRTGAQRLKAALQRRNYASAVGNAAMMVFNSEYMRGAYRKNANAQERSSEVVYQALDDATHEKAAQMGSGQGKKAMQILSASVMAPHKGVETLAQSLRILRSKHGIPAELVLVGAWPDAGYERRIRKLIHSLKLDEKVTIRGHVTRDELHQLYASSKVFALMSQCESFGIPAIEAQAFGTPVVSSNCCAIPEVCGEGGYYPEPGDAAGTAERLAQLLDNPRDWETVSQKAVQNASRYRWDQCSRGMMRMFEQDWAPR